MITVPVLVAAVAFQRLWELRLAARNARRLCARGAVEYGAAHYPLFVALHAAWLLSLLLLIPWQRRADPALLAVFLALQGLRGWTMATLGARWTTRVFVVPGETPIRRGPYRFLRHPNYFVVALEIPLLPAAFGALGLAAAFGIANLALLALRIAVEERAWREMGAPAAEKG